MHDFPALIADFTPLADASGLQNLGLSCEYCRNYGWFFSAHAFRGAAVVTLLFNLPAVGAAELRTALQDALLDQLGAYYISACQL